MTPDFEHWNNEPADPTRSVDHYASLGQDFEAMARRRKRRLIWRRVITAAMWASGIALSLWMLRIWGMLP
jgi:hypothetical protein